MKIRDTVICILSDLHSGGSTALFPPRMMQFKHGNHTPTKEQRRMYKHFMSCAADVLSAREGKRLIVVVDGDAIDGVHHHSPQVVTRLINEQREIHIELMDAFLQSVSFDNESGDLLYYVSGTEVHVGDIEDAIGRDLGAEPNGKLGAFDMLRLRVNSRELWFAHHGASAGKGANKGNAHRNWLRNVYYDCVDNGDTPPDMVVTGHVHQPSYQVYVQQEGSGYHMLHGIICPSWQMKTRFAHMVAPVSVNKIGLAYFGITADGFITPPKIPVLTTTAKVVKV